MNRIAAAAAALLLAVPVLASPATPAKTKKDALTRTVHGKPQAPVSVTARLRPDGATLTVRFHSAASDVRLDVHGVEGLAVTSAANPLSGGRFARGEAVSFDVSFTPGPGRSLLAVGVSGRFGTATRSTVATFTIGEPSAEQRKASETATTDSTGQRVKILPAETR